MKITIASFQTKTFFKTSFSLHFDIQFFYGGKAVNLKFLGKRKFGGKQSTYWG